MKPEKDEKHTQSSGQGSSEEAPFPTGESDERTDEYE